ncbi:hypothetical protein PsYK624_001780 [Phanerochaete sordida]|uniref:Uncharacterized protein n=1 Tax=Phanerochaete sordida TaxID=48140 RepID=A0A9P3L7L1_9APHY|nr:hypothetical protein PsYK624_001780 [Phanerochaete sordida]
MRRSRVIIDIYWRQGPSHNAGANESVCAESAGVHAPARDGRRALMRNLHDPHLHFVPQSCRTSRVV